MVVFFSPLIFCVSFFIPATSHFLGHVPAQEARGLHQQHDDEHGEQNGVGQLGGYVRLGQRLDDPQQDAPQKRPGDGPDAAEHRSGKRLDAGHGAGGGHEGGGEGAQQPPRHRRQRGADGEGQRDGGVDVDAHQLRRPLVLRAGPHGLAQLGPAGEKGEQHHDDNTRPHGEQGDVGDGQLPAEQPQGIGLPLGVGGGDEGGIPLGGGPPDELGRVLQKIAHADGGDEHRQGGGLPQGFVGQPLNDHAQRRTYRHGQHHRQPAGQAQVGHGAEGDVAAHHDDIAMGKVEHFGDAVHHGVPQGDDGVHAPQADSADQIGKEFHRRTSLFLTLAMCQKRGRGTPCPRPRHSLEQKI